MFFAVCISFGYRIHFSLLVTADIILFILDIRRREAPNRLPEGFPGTVGVAFNPTKNPAVQLNDKYRRYEYGAGGDGDLVTSGSFILNDGDHINDASGHNRITSTDSGATILKDEAGNAALTLNTDQSVALTAAKILKTEKQNAIKELKGLATRKSSELTLNALSKLRVNFGCYLTIEFTLYVLKSENCDF